MAKIRVIIPLVIILAAAIFFFWQKSSFFKQNPSIQPTQEEEQTNQDSKYNPEGLVAGVKEVIAQIEKDSTKRVEDFIDEQKKEITKQLLGIQESEVKVTPKQPTDINQSQQKIIVIDLTHDTNLLFNLKRAELVYLTFKNARAGHCLYINDTKYNIIEGQLQELEFVTTGTFSIKTNFCDLNYSEHGKFIVE